MLFRLLKRQVAYRTPELGKASLRERVENSEVAEALRKKGGGEVGGGETGVAEAAASAEARWPSRSSSRPRKSNSPRPR